MKLPGCSPNERKRPMVFSLAYQLEKKICHDNRFPCSRWRLENNIVTPFSPTNSFALSSNCLTAFSLYFKFLTIIAQMLRFPLEVPYIRRYTFKIASGIEQRVISPSKSSNSSLKSSPSNENT